MNDGYGSRTRKVYLMQNRLPVSFSNALGTREISTLVKAME